ncbi:MAG: hypothetical protein ACRBM6_29740 [Geminicoccales bacterium]
MSFHWSDAARRMVITTAVAGVALSAVAASAASSDLPTKEINGLTGPAKPVGMAIEELGAITLGKEFPQIAAVADRLMRGRHVTVKAGGIVPIHSHKDRPAVTYILDGEIIEHRSDVEGALVRKAGDCTLDVSGISQWWENKSDRDVHMFTVDLYDPSIPTDY